MPLENEKRNSFMVDRKAFPEKIGRFAISVCQKTRKHLSVRFFCVTFVPIL